MESHNPIGEPERRGEEGTRRRDDLRRLTDLSRNFTYATSVAEILQHAAEQAAHLVDADKAILMLADNEGLLRVHAAYGISDEIFDRFRASFDETLADRLTGLFGTKEGFLGVPLVTQGRVIGLLAVLRKDDVGTENDEWLLSALADQMAAPIENAKLAAKLERAALLVENARLYESERVARREAEAARAEAERRRHEAEEANRAKSKFVANMSHDLRTPLNAIAGYVELLEMGIRGDLNAGQLGDIRRIAQNQRVLASLINDVLNFAKLEIGQIPFELSNVPLDECLAAMEALVMPQVQARELRYTYVAVESALTVYADREKLQQIMLNLLSNAIKFTSPHGEIAVSAALDGPWVAIQVRDSGRGIPKDMLEEIFSPFVRIDTDDVRATEGSGLGLAIGRELARKMGGDLSASSIREQGSTFTLRLPRSRT